MDKIKIAFFDIDGTLIDMERKEISEKMLETLKDLQKNDVKNLYCNRSCANGDTEI